MKTITASFQLLGNVDADSILNNIESFGRICYKSESNITSDSAEAFIRRIIKSGHESVIEHEKISVRIICDRGVTHEIVRHRIASYSQESTRYCNYAQEKFGRELTFIKPCFWDDKNPAYKIWLEQMQSAENAYIEMIDLGIAPEQARSVLPNSLKTEIVVTMNLREWRHFFKLRTSKRAHPQMREISLPLLSKFQKILPAVFEDIEPE
ncbi:thymidylate synthase [Clostridia bacterium]|nr:thymidylate synthase [Clostridia bacterium]